MRIAPAILAAVALTIGVAGPAAAHPQTDVQPPLSVDLAHAATDNVAFVARFHEHFGSAGGTVTSNDWNDGQEFFVVTDPRGIFTYDLTEPENPVLLDFELVNQGISGTGAALGQEDPSTDGRLVLMDGASERSAQEGLTETAASIPADPENPDTGKADGALHILSIEDPTDIQVVGVHPSTDHTWTCVSDVETGNGCAYAYGRSDNIIDITDPAAPVAVETGWKTATGETGYAHDLTEIRPGLVMHAGAEPVLMDTTDPAAPVKISHVTLFDHGAEYPAGRQWSSLGYHSVEWARGGEDAFLVMGTELAPSGSTNLAGSDCNSDQSVIETWDARPVLAAFDEVEALKADGMSHADARDAVFGDGDRVKFERIDAYMAFDRGIFLDGQAPGQVLYCAHWMEPERDFEDGGRLVAGYYNRGARFIEVAPVGATDEDGNDISGTMSEIGWFTGADAYTGSAQWVTDEVVYVMDYARGMDIIKIADAEATSTYTGTGSVSEQAMTVAELDALGIAPPPAAGGPSSTLVVMLAAVLFAGAGLRRRVRVRDRS